MAQPTSISDLRDRLTGLLADWGTEVAEVLKELEEQRARGAEVEAQAAGRSDELDALRQRVEGQNALIEALKGDAEEAALLRAEVRNKDLELERVSSELESKKELVRALRRDADGSERTKGDLKQKDREIEELRAKLQRAERLVAESAGELAMLREAAAGRSEEEASELESLRSELEARKTVIKSLRADQDRVAALQSSLDEKREIIEQLEASISRHSNTIAELRRSADTWKRKYHAVKGDSPTATTSINLPSLSDTDVRVIEELENVPASKADATIAIDMRRSLLEARRTVAKAHGEK
jgi:chromosome segregation ATPase